MEAFFYGRALATTLNRRLSEALIDFVSEVSKQAAERPQRLAEFQDEVSALARKEMASSGYALPESSSAGGGSGGSGGSSGAAAGPPTVLDQQAAIDDLRAEIAYARAALQDIRTNQKAPVAQK